MKMGKKVAINGFGRIGRLTFRALLKKDNIEVVAINDLTDAATLAFLLKYDSVQGNLTENISAEGNEIVYGKKRIKVFSERNPADLKWRDLNIDVVLESTGIFRTKEKASLHIEAGAKKVIISAPSKSNDIPTVVLGVNEEILLENHDVLSNASCTTNCLAPIAKIINDNFEIENGFITTVHSYTSDQRLLDAPHSDLRRARSAALSMIPTTTGAAEATGLVLPSLQGKLDGMAVRVPTPTGSLTDMVFNVKKTTTAEEVNALVKKYSENEMKGIVEYSEAPIVSADIVGNSYSSIFDAPLTKVNGNTIKLISWYDNEFGYSSRLADLMTKI